MNKRLLVGMFTALMAFVPLSGYADQTIDSPHLNVNKPGETESCTECHFANYQPSDCIRCHNNAAEVPSSAIVATHQALACESCHNPHVSLQGNGIAGSYSGAQADTPSTGMTTLTGVTPTPETSWAEKTAPDRGMILWIPNGTDAQGKPQSVSYEVQAVDAAAGTVTVKGTVPATSGNFDLRRGQLIAKKITKTAGNSYKQGDLPVDFPSASGNTSIFIDTQNGTTPKGVCQVCHVSTGHWKSDGSLADHNADRACTECHKHSTGFAIPWLGCNGCHGGANIDGSPTDVAGLAQPATGSVTFGAHAVHSTPIGNPVTGTGGYDFDCEYCHSGTGMPDEATSMNQIVNKDGIQIGFDILGKFKGYLSSYNGQRAVNGPGGAVFTPSHYVATNHTTVTNTGAVGEDNMKCSNVYCHSDGKGLRLNCATSTNSTSPAWDGSSPDPQGDTTTCNNCHGFTAAYANRMGNVNDSHQIHITRGYACYVCHMATVGDDGNGNPIITNKVNHVNAVRNIQGGTWLDRSTNPPTQTTINLTYDTNTHQGCAIVCHPAGKLWRTDLTTTTCPDPCSGDALVNDRPTLDVQCSNVDTQTIMFSISMTDTDYNDSVKKQCAAALGQTGYNGTGGGFNLKYGGGAAAWSVTKESPEEWGAGVSLAGTPTMVVEAYPAGAVKPANFALTGHNNPYVMAYIKAWDNSPNAQSVATADDTWNPGEGWVFAPQATEANFNYFPCEIRPDYDTMLNQPARINFSKTQVDLNTITITDLSVDPDYNDVAKADYYDALATDGDGGHRGEGGYIHVYYNRGEGDAWHAMTITDVVTPRDIPHTRWNGSANVPNTGPGSHSWVLANPGSVWFFYEVVDNHYLYQNPSPWSTTGWINHIFQ